MIYLVANEALAPRPVFLEWSIRDLDPNCPLHSRLRTTGFSGRFESSPDVRVELRALEGCVMPEVYVRGFLWMVSERIQKGLLREFGDGLNHVAAEFRSGVGVPEWVPYLMDTRLLLDVVDWRKSDYFVMPSGDRVLNLEGVAFRRSKIPAEPAVFRARDYPALLFANQAGKDRMVDCGMDEGFFQPLSSASPVERGS